MTLLVSALGIALDNQLPIFYRAQVPLSVDDHLITLCQFLFGYLWQVPSFDLYIVSQLGDLLEICLSVMASARKSELWSFDCPPEQ